MMSSNNPMSCIFCKIVAGTLPALIIYQDEQVMVIQDQAPKASIHYLIIPRKHLESLQSLGPEDTQLAAHLLFTAQKLGSLNGQPQDFKLVSNNGANAGQIVFHLHIHFLAGTTIGNV